MRIQISSIEEQDDKMSPAMPAGAKDAGEEKKEDGSTESDKEPKDAFNSSEEIVSLLAFETPKTKNPPQPWKAAWTNQKTPVGTVVQPNVDMDVSELSQTPSPMFAFHSRLKGTPNSADITEFARTAVTSVSGKSMHFPGRLEKDGKSPASSSSSSHASGKSVTFSSIKETAMNKASMASSSKSKTSTATPSSAKHVAALGKFQKALVKVVTKGSPDDSNEAFSTPVGTRSDDGSGLDYSVVSNLSEFTIMGSWRGIVHSLPPLLVYRYLADALGYDVRSIDGVMAAVVVVYFIALYNSWTK